MCIKAKIKKKNWLVRFITGKNISGITLAPFAIYLREDSYIKQNKILINHEKIHWQQQLEMLVILFYVIYVLEWFVRLFINGSEAYRSISFEREAYSNEHDLEYLNNRKKFSWIKYFSKNK